MNKEETETGGDREETLVELGSRFLKRLGEMVKDIEESPDLHEDIDDAYIEKLKHYIHQWDQIDFNDLTDAIARSSELEGEIDNVKIDLDILKREVEDLDDIGEHQEFADLKMEVSENSQSIESITEDVSGLDRRFVKIEKIYNIIKLALQD